MTELTIGVLFSLFLLGLCALSDLHERKEVAKGGVSFVCIDGRMLEVKQGSLK